MDKYGDAINNFSTRLLMKTIVISFMGAGEVRGLGVRGLMKIDNAIR